MGRVKGSTYPKGQYFHSPQSSTVIKSKMVATTIRTRTRFRPPKIRLHCRLHPMLSLFSSNRISLSLSFSPWQNHPTSHPFHITSCHLLPFHPISLRLVISYPNSSHHVSSSPMFKFSMFDCPNFRYYSENENTRRVKGVPLFEQIPRFP